jgi:hypothetical protein
LLSPIATLPGPSVSLLWPIVTDSSETKLEVPIVIASSPFTLEFLPKAIELFVLSLKLIELPEAIILSEFLA